MRVAVVGAGVAGLTAAYDLGRAGVEVLVLEGSDRIGGKLRLADVAGVTLDVGAEALLARRPEATELCAEIGLGDVLVHPATTSAAIWTRGALRPMPPTVMGIPADLDALMASGIVAEVPVSRPLPPPSDDVSVGEFVRPRVGDEVLDRLVEPILGGVYAGHADDLSLTAASPQILALGDDLLAGAAATLERPEEGPVFAGLAGGLGQIPDVLAEKSGAEARTGAVVRDVEPAGAGWRIVLGDGEESVDGVVVATPAPAAARLLANAVPEAAFELADIIYASMAIVTVVVDDAVELPGSGFLVPPVDGTAIKGSTFSSRKWSWLAESKSTVLRASVGRAGDTALLHRDDDVVAAAALADLRSALGKMLPDPAGWHVQRWGGALPQYAVGHLDRIAVVERAVAAVPGLEVCGAAYAGVGVPAVIASARGAVRRLLADLGD